MARSTLVQETRRVAPHRWGDPMRDAYAQDERSGGGAVSAPLSAEQAPSPPPRRPSAYVDLEREARVLEFVRKECPNDALALLMQTYGGPLSGYINGLEPDRDRVRDLHQEVFLQVLKGIEQYEGRNNSSIWNWLCCIARNRYRDVCRKRPPLAAVSIDDPEVCELLVASPNDDVAASGHVVMHKRLLQCLHKLPIHMRKRVLMYYIEGLSYAEIARQIGSKFGAVQRSIARMMQRLRDCMIGKGEL